MAGTPDVPGPPDALLPPIEPPREIPTHPSRPEAATPAANATDSGPAEVHVHIGRIEVTAVQDSPPAKHSARKGKPPMSLDEYLARHQGEDA